MTHETIWWEAVPGLDWRYLPTAPGASNRIVALFCAGRARPLNVRKGSHRDTAWLQHFRAYRDWFDAAPDGWDAYMRRIALAYACTDPPEGASHAEMLQVAKVLHTELTAPGKHARRQESPAAGPAHTQ